MESSVTLLALDCGARQKASVAGELLLLNQVFESSVNIDPLLTRLVIFHEIVCLKAFLMEV